jgi:hypothetical protein
MAYRIETFDNGLEALLLTAIVRDATVEMDWLHDGDDAESYAQRFLARVKTIVDPDASSYPPQTAFLLMRLYRRGDVSVSGMSCADGYREQAIRLAEEAALGIYDEVYPDVAQVARAFVEENVEMATSVAADSKLSVLAVEEGDQLSPDQFLPHLLDIAKAGLAETGEVVQRIGWLVNNRMALFPFGMPPLEKYRYFAAVGEVARRVNADAVVHISDAYQLTADGERTGQEVLQVAWVNPDASAVAAFQVYMRKKDPVMPEEIIAFVPDEAPSISKMEQNLIPAWGSYHPH